MNLLTNISLHIPFKKIGILLVNNTPTGKEMMYYQLSKKGKSVDISFQQEYSDKLLKIAEKVPNILCIQGAGVVHRTIALEQTDIKESIPNIEIEQFLIRIVPLAEKKMAVLYRKEDLAELLNLPGISELPVFSIAPGLACIPQFSEFFGEDVSEFESGGHSLCIEERKINDVRKAVKQQAQQYLFAGMLYSAEEIMGLCAGLEFFTQSYELRKEFPYTENRIKEFTARKLTESIIKYVGAALFILLLLNFLFFDSLNNKYNTLNIESQDLLKLQKEIHELREDFNQKEQFINQNNVPENYSYAFYADRLSSFSAHYVNLEELSVCPVAGKIKEGKLIIFRNRTLLVKGTAKNSSAFSSFMNKINSAQWVSGVNKQVYKYNNEYGNAEFELEIVLNNAVE